MSYVCPHCGTLDINLEVPIQNILNYRGASRVAAPCCKKPIRVSSTIVIHVAALETDEDTDDWGEPYSKNKD